VRVTRKPLKSPPISPEIASWDNPFPTFPGTKKKSSREEERDIVQKMADMDVGVPPQQGRGGGRGSPERYAGGRPIDDYGRPSMDSQRNMARGPPQSQGYFDPRRGPPGPGSQGRPSYENPRQNGYSDPGYDNRSGYGPPAPAENFGHPARSMTMPNQPPMGQTPRQPPLPMDPSINERPYNGPIGRGMPPRPSTTTGVRQQSQRNYPNQAPVPNQQYPDPYGTGSSNQSKPQPQGHESVSDFYDAYYDGPDPSSQHTRSQSVASEMPNFDVVAANSGSHRRGDSIDEHIQPGPPPRGNAYEQNNSYAQQVKPVQSRPDSRARAQPQAAVFEMAAEIPPPNPNGYQQGYDDRYAQNGGYNGQQSGNGGYGGFPEPALQPPQKSFIPPPRSTSAAPRSAPAGLPNGPKSGFAGLPNGPNGPNGRPSPQGRRTSAEALPSHPPPVRAGLIPNSVASNMVNKPAPVRNYNHATPSVTAQPSKSSSPAAAPSPSSPAPVTIQELEQLRLATQNNPNDQKAQLTLARKLVEASEILVPKIPDQRQRSKTREKYVMDAHKVLKKLVAVQNSDAMFYLADCYGRGALGLEPDNKEAFTLYQSAAKAGHAGAAYRTAVCCELGNDDGGGTRKDPLKAIQWYKRAATLGDTPAMYKMGMIGLKGLLGQPRNPREAVGWLKRAAERADAENPHALHELGLLYELPQGPDGSIMRDETYSFELFKQAAELGYKPSQFRMGCAYEYGLFGCPIDPRMSIQWYSRAAVQEEHHSELALSGWYLTGSEGVLQQSDTEAYLWARKAAMAGNAKAEYAMGYFTEVGIGILANLDDAKRWYWRAAGSFPYYLQD
jgi:TPR repeat protein